MTERRFTPSSVHRLAAMQSAHATRSPASQRSPPLTIALVAGILGLLLLIAPWPERHVLSQAHETTSASEIPDDPESAAAARAKQTRFAGEASDDAPADTVATPCPPARSTGPDSTVVADPAAPAMALAEDGTPLWKTKRTGDSAVGGSSVAESEYRRQTRIWLQGAQSGRHHRSILGKGQKPQQLEKTSELRYPDDLTAQILYKAGYEWGFVTSIGNF